MADFPYKYEDIYWPTLKALEALGGSATNSELEKKVADTLGLTYRQANLMHKNKNYTVLGYRIAWARTKLKFIGAVENTQRSLWAITNKGRRIDSEESLIEKVKQYSRKQGAKNTPKHRRKESSSIVSKIHTQALGQLDWMHRLLGVLWGIEPSAFARFCLKLLRELGFSSIKTTGHTSEDGVDGIGAFRTSIVSFSIKFRFVRHVELIHSSDIRNFRKSIAGQDKGLLITTGKFTNDAVKEATKEGVLSIGLIDGAQLCNLLKDIKWGVKEMKIIEPDHEFFQKI